MILKTVGKVVKRIVITSTLVGGGLTSVVLYNVSRSKWSTSHTWSSATRHYLTNKFMVGLGYLAFRNLVKQSRDIRSVQEKFLLNAVLTNKDTDYGKDNNFNDILNIADFQTIHPLTTYSHYASYVDRIKNGELTVITKDPPLQLAVTSGTSGQSSLLPTTNHIFTRFFLSGIALLFQRLNSAHPEWTTLQRSMKLFYQPRWRYTDSGLRIGPNSSNPDSAKRIYHLYSTPPPAYRILSEPEALYIHLLFALLDPNIGIIESNFAATVYTGLKSLETSWKDIVKDIETGVIRSSLDIPDDVREELQKALQANPGRAKELRDEFELGFDDIVKRVWPNINLVLCTTTGSMEMYHKALKSKYLRSVPTYSPIYGASEGLLGVNLYPDRDESLYCLIPDAQFFEFIPQANMDDKSPETLLLHQLKKDGVYEVVVTNGSGLYRYRMGDVIKVREFFNELPVIEFQYRQGQILNLHGEKISEQIMWKCLQDLESTWQTSNGSEGAPTSGGKVDEVAITKLRDYTVAESVLFDSDSATPHYVLFIETNGPTLPENSSDELDNILEKNHPVYTSFRVKGSIGKPKIIQVTSGTFTRLKQHILESSLASSNQFKVARVVKKKELVDFLLENRVQ